jgi:hypothetical protein
MWAFRGDTRKFEALKKDEAKMATAVDQPRIVMDCLAIFQAVGVQCECRDAEPFASEHPEFAS